MATNWHDIRRKQMSYVQNILLVIFSAFFGYLISFITNNQVINQYRCFFNLMLIISVVLILLNLSAALIRLLDFRKMANNPKQNNPFDTWTWPLLYMQLVLFGVLLISFLIFVWINFA